MISSSLKLSASAETLLPGKLTFTGSWNQDLDISFEGNKSAHYTLPSVAPELTLTPHTKYIYSIPTSSKVSTLYTSALCPVSSKYHWLPLHYLSALNLVLEGETQYGPP